MLYGYNIEKEKINNDNKTLNKKKGGRCLWKKFVLKKITQKYMTER